MLETWTSRIRRRLNRQRDLEIRLNAAEVAIACLCEGDTYAAGESVGLNGQRGRKEIFADLAAAFAFEIAVETGTWIGDTTGYLATTLNVPVHSCELHKIPHLVAKRRLSGIPRIRLERNDSRTFLDGLRAVIPSATRCLFYLDAHWHTDLPLAQELKIISETWRNYVIVIDDFRVPGDDRYAYDAYGRGKSLSLEDFRSVFARHDLVSFFPRLPSAQETGYKRGCVVLAPAGAIADRIRELSTLVAKETGPRS